MNIMHDHNDISPEHRNLPLHNNFGVHSYLSVHARAFLLSRLRTGPLDQYFTYYLYHISYMVTYSDKFFLNPVTLTRPSRHIDDENTEGDKDITNLNVT